MTLGPTARFALRVTVVSVLAGLAVLKVALGDNDLTASEIVECLYLSIGAGAAYAGIGAVSRNVEPHVARKLDV